MIKIRTDRPSVSIIIPTRNLSYYLLFETLPSFERQTYKKFEVIVVVNEQVPYDLTLLKKYKWLRIVPSGKITRPAKKRDIGAQVAAGNILAFIDDDAYPDPDWLEKAMPLFKDKQIGAIAGPGVLPKDTNNWEKIFDEVLKTPLGAGSYTYRFVQGKKRYVDDYPSMNFLISKKLFKKIGGFNSAYWPGEDSKLCEEIVYRENKKILYDPSVLVYHHRRNNLSGYLAQHGNYGFHRGAFFAHGDRNSKRLGYLIPSLFVSYLYLILADFVISVFLPQISMLNAFYPFTLFPLFLYMTFQLLLFFRALYDTRDFKIAFGAPVTLFLTHFWYGIMFFRGFFTGKIKKDDIYGTRRN